MKKKTKKHKALTLEETVELFGANAPQDIGPVRLDPLGMQALATRVGARLAKKRGRPTDTRWNLVRKIPMEEKTWIYLQQLAASISKKASTSVAAGQMGAIALERGVHAIEIELSATQDGREHVMPALYNFSDESRNAARALCGTVASEGTW